MAFHHHKKAIGQKIKKIMHEGVRGKKVSQKQAIAIAFSMARKGKKKKSLKGRVKQKGKIVY